MPDAKKRQAVARPDMTWRYTVLTLRKAEAGSLANRAGRLFGLRRSGADAFTHAGKIGGAVPRARACVSPSGRPTVRRTRPAGSVAAADALCAGGLASQLPARPRR